MFFRLYLSVLKPGKQQYRLCCNSLASLGQFLNRKFFNKANQIMRGDDEWVHIVNCYVCDGLDLSISY